MTVSTPTSRPRTRSRPLLIFDGDCRFCRLWIERWRAITGESVEYAPYQEAAASLPNIPLERFHEAVYLVDTDGRIYRAAEAVFRSLAVRPGWRGLLWAYRRVPGVRPVTETAYRLVARRRGLASRLTRVLWGHSVTPPSYLLARWLFLRGLGLTYLLAFLSLWPQVDGLIGPDGILPYGIYLRAAHQQLGADAYHLVPTLAWLHPEGTIAAVLCGAGVGLSVLLLAGLLPVPVLVLLWATYLSVVSIGQVFLAFQWDLLLLESGFLAIFLAPGGFRPGLGTRSPPPRLAVWLILWLLFRLMFASGLVKLGSGDATWWDLTALSVHYETQPLPTAFGWVAHQLPPGLQKASCLAMFGIELGLPFLIPLPRRPRLVAAGGFLFLMSVITLTGNYGFFNLLAALLCLFLIDDTVLARLAPARARAALPGSFPRPRPSRPRTAFTVGVFVALGGLSLALFAGRFLGFEHVPGPVRAALTWIRPFRSVNNYGLFSVMTTRRPEIRVEGSRDGRSWKPYVFRYKIGNPARPPRWVAPHMPRLDWQMWFAALGSCRGTPWFSQFMGRLLEGSEPVLRLLEDNPFPDAPPRYIRTLVDDYRFTDAGIGAGGPWWRVEPRGPYCPVVSRRSP